MAGESETALVRASLVGPQLEDGWRWVREEKEWWRFGQDGMEVATRPGGLLGKVAGDLVAPPLLLRALDGANACEVIITMPASPGAAGEQAGLFWYVNDDNYAKLVIERGQDNTASVVLGRKQQGKYTVCGEAELDEEETQEPTRLRLEMSSDGSRLSGCIVKSYYTQLIGSCPASADTWGENAQAEAPLSFGISAHGGVDAETLAARSACFKNFSAIAVKPNRVQWADASATVPQAMAAPIQTQEPLSPAMPGGYAPPAPGADCAAPVGGWTLSDNLTEEQRSQIAGLLAQSGLPSLDAPAQ